MEHLTVFLYLLRFCVIFSVIMLWVVAMSEIRSHARRGLFTTAQLASMAIAVSIVAVGAIATLNVIVPLHQGTAIDPRGGASGPPDGQECNASSYTFTYSFGLTRPTSLPQECMAGQAGSSQLPHAPR